MIVFARNDIEVPSNETEHVAEALVEMFNSVDIPDEMGNKL